MKQSKFNNVFDRGILLVDDEEDTLDFLDIFIKASGFTNVFKANSPLEAIETLAILGEKVFLVLTDIIMPQMNGYEMVQHIINTHPIHVGIIFMTGFKYDPDHSLIKLQKEHIISNECLFGSLEKFVGTFR